MKLKFIMLPLFICFAGKLASQNRLNEFVIEKANNTQRFYKDKGCTPNDGVLVFYSPISNLTFAIPNASSRLKSVSAFDNEKNCYVLCIQPTEKEIGSQYIHYSIKITAPGYKPEEAFRVSDINAGVAQYFTINPVEDEETIKLKNDVKNANQKIKQAEQERKAAERKAEQEKEKREEAERNALRPPRKPLIEDWSKDFKIIVGLSNGIVAGEIGGMYGEVKFGERTGFALEGGFGGGIGENDMGRWAIGVKGLYNNFFLSSYYGTTMNVANRSTSLIMNDDGSFILEGSRTGGRKGVSLLGGYDRTFGWFHFTAGVGGTATTIVNPKFQFAWNVGIGISLTDLMK